MQCDRCNHDLLITDKRNIMAVYPQKGKVDIVCMLVGASQGNDPQGKPVCVVLSSWKGEQDGLEYCPSSKDINDVAARNAFDAATRTCPVDVLFVNIGADKTNFQYLSSLIKAARAVHPKICVYMATADKKLSIKCRGDETEREKAQFYITGAHLMRDLEIAVRVVSE